MSMMRKVLLALLVLTVASGAAFATNVTFQVDMSFQFDQGNFNPMAGDNVVVRGSMNEWAGNDMQLTADPTSGIYSGTFDIAAGDYEYKYVMVFGDGSDDGWESIDNRTLTVGDTEMTLDVVWFNNQEPVETTNVEVLFQVDMSVQILNGSFNPETDLIVVRGGHPNLGDWGGAIALSAATGSEVYTLWIQFDELPIGTPVEYKYVILTNGDPDQANWESVDNRTFTPTGEEQDTDSNGYGEIITPQVYFSDVTMDDILSDDLVVNFRVNMQPAILKLADPDSIIYDVQTGDTVTSIDEVDVAGYFNAWPWGSFAPENILHDDGVAPDEAAGDNVYSAAVQFYAGDPKELVFKFGINGLDVEAGVGENHSVMLNNDNADFTIYAVFGSSGTLYDPYMSEVSAPETGQTAQPMSFSLEQNYPNPFNPTTNIVFTLPQASRAHFTVFNIQGREVLNQDLGQRAAGRQSIAVDGSNLSSGIYFYRLEANGLSATKKMMLLK